MAELFITFSGNQKTWNPELVNVFSTETHEMVGFMKSYGECTHHQGEIKAMKNPPGPVLWRSGAEGLETATRNGFSFTPTVEYCRSIYIYIHIYIYIWVNHPQMALI